MTTSRETFTQTATDLRTAAKAYYDSADETMTDAAYDQGIEALRIAIAENPSWASDVADLLEQVAAGQSSGGDLAHTSHMGSMDKAKTVEEVLNFLAKTTGTLVIEPKLDGMAVAATYVGGVLVSMSTRGDGESGDDMVSRASRVTGLPATVSRLDTFEVRGEVYMSDADFNFSQAARVATGKAPFKNPRNAVAGVLRKAVLAHPVKMSFAAYEAATGPDSHLARMVELEALGFAVAYRLLGDDDVTATGSHRVLAMIDAFDSIRATAGFPADGIVIKADSNNDRAALGYGSRSPKWAIAFKYDAEFTTTVVEDVEVTIGRTGRMGLRFRYATAHLRGNEYQFASAHNVSWVAEHDIRIGDTVVLELANDVIPYIPGPILEDRPADSKPWVAPATCPQCGEPWETTTLLWRCESPECSVLGRIVYFASRNYGVDIEGLGVEVATALVESGKVSDIADLFDLTVSDLANLDMNGRNLGQANGAKIHAQIAKSKGANWNRVITGLGLRKSGRTVGRWLAAKYPSMRLLRAASVSSLMGIDGLGDIKAQFIRDGLLAMAPVLNRLEAAGVNMGTEKAVTAAPKPLAGQTVVVSGSVPGMSRTEVAEFIEAHGGKSSGSVSASTTMLVSEPSTSSKYVKAQTLKVRIVTPAEFLVLCQG